jgi:hypothetical protein
VEDARKSGMSALGQQRSFYIRDTQGPESAITGHSLVTIRLYIQAVVENSPYTISSGVVAAVSIAYLLFVLVLLVLFSS